MAKVSLADLQNAAKGSVVATSGQSDVPAKTTKFIDPLGIRQLSVKVQQPNYTRLKKAAAVTEMSHQDILTESLELWLREHGF